MISETFSQGLPNRLLIPQQTRDSSLPDLYPPSSWISSLIGFEAGVGFPGNNRHVLPVKFSPLQKQTGVTVGYNGGHRALPYRYDN